MGGLPPSWHSLDMQLTSKKTSITRIVRLPVCGSCFPKVDADNGENQPIFKRLQKWSDLLDKEIVE